MTTPVSPTPFVIRPADNLLELYPQIRRASQELALAYAFQKLVDEEHLRAMGLMLWQALAIDGELAEAQKKVGTAVLPLIVESDVAAVQQLPWETLYHPEHGFLGKSEGFTLLRRRPGQPVSMPSAEPGPLRVLLFTSLPDDLDAEKSRLDVEEEQAQVLEALTPLIKKGIVQLEMPDDGRFTTLKTLLRETQPHLVFLSGHGQFVDQPGQEEPPFAVFQFEDDEGQSDFVREETIANAFKGTGVRCVVLSACESGKGSSVALNQGLTWRLAALGIPHVLGMRESVLDRAGTLFVRELCDQLVKGEAVDVALQRGRQAITRPLANSPWLKADSTGLAEISLGQWCLPMLISRSGACRLLIGSLRPNRCRNGKRILCSVQ